MERLGYIDIVKFIGIFLMVLCHAGMHNGATSVIYAFHMPLFFFISGYMFNPKKKRKVSSILKSKGKAVLIPYFIFALILCFGTRKMADWPLLIYGSRDALHAASSFTQLWFLPCFFLSTVFFQTIAQLKMRSEILFAIAVIGCSVLGFVLSFYRTHLQYGFPWNFDTALVGVGIMYLGYITRKVNAVERLNYVWGGVILIIGAGMSFYNLPESLTQGNPHVEMSVSSYGNPVLFTLNLSLLCVAIVILAREIENRWEGAVLKKLQFYGANTIIILCVHGSILKFFQLTLKSFHFEGTIYALVMTLVCFALLPPIIIFINSEMPNIVGRDKVEK